MTTMPSLKDALHHQIKERGFMSTDYVNQFARDFGLRTRGRPYKQSNAERRLRELYSEDTNFQTDIEPVYNNHNFIRGYRMKYDQTGQAVFA